MRSLEQGSGIATAAWGINNWLGYAITIILLTLLWYGIYRDQKKRSREKQDRSDMRDSLSRDDQGRWPR